MHISYSVLKYDCLCDTYTPQSVAALARIRDLVQQQLQATKRTVEERSDALQRYRQTGDDFQKVVAEYAQLLEAIHEKQWTLRELAKSGGSEQ